MNDVKKIREIYKPGTRVQVEYMAEEKYAPPAGTRGTVSCVDDLGGIFVHWDNGSGLALIVEADKFCIVSAPTTVCNGETRNWDTMEEALSYFNEAMKNSEGSERERYATICSKLKSGELFVTDKIK